MIARFKKRTRKMNPMLLNVIVISAILHVVAAVLVGGYIVSTSMQTKEPEFEPPPSMERIEPKKIQYQVQMAEQQKKSASSKPQKRIQVKAINNLNVPKINIALPQINTKIGVSGMSQGIGRGTGLGGGGGLGMGAKAVSLFKVKASGERFLFLVDASERTMTDIKGGLKAYNAIRNEITKLINGLPPSIVFNVGFFDTDSSSVQFKFFKESLQAATPDVKKEFSDWVKTVNPDTSNTGIEKTNYSLKKRMPRSTMNHALQITQVAMEQKADAAFIISGGWQDVYEKVRRSPNREELKWLRAEREKRLKEYEKAGWDRAKLREHAKERARWAREAQQAYAAYQKKRESSGVGRQLGSNWQTWASKNFKEVPEGPPDPRPEYYTPGNFPFYYEKKDVQAYLRSVIDEHYGSGASRQKYSINLIVFMGDAEIEQFEQKDKKGFRDMQNEWKSFTRDFRGRYSLLKSKTDAIKSE